MVRLVLLTTVLQLLMPHLAAAKGPWDDAVAAWHFKDLDDTADGSRSLVSTGKTKVGLPLDSAARAGSKLRGGDGFAAQLRMGGFLSAAGSKELDIAGRQMTILARVALADRPADISLVSKHTATRLPWNVFITTTGERPLIVAEIATTGNNGPLRVSVPLDELRRQPWHDVVCRVDGAKLELFVDGRCVDEDFMLGDLVTGRGPVLLGVVGGGKKIADAGTVAQVDHIAIWRRGLSADEIVAVSGGREVADTRQRTERGDLAESMQYWKPPNEYNVGDCFPFYHDGRFHFAYLIDKHHHRSKNGLGAHQWAQATSRDLVHWKHHPLTVPITKQWEGSICTGSFFWHDGLYYAFYATRSAGDGPLPKWHQGIAIATSRDGIHFTKQDPNPLFALPEKYGPADCRDPVVFHDKTTGTFHMMITSVLKTGGGCLVHMTSKDLKKWKEAEPIVTGKGHPECPSHFEWNGKYYLTYCWAQLHYYTSDNPAGPWKKPKRHVVCYGDAYVPKVAPYRDNRRLVCAWIPMGGWGGVSLWRELVQLPDGSLGSRWPKELIPATGDPLKLAAITLRGKGEQQFKDLPRSYRLTLRVSSDKAKAAFGVRLRDDGKESIDLRVERSNKKIILGHQSMPWESSITKLDILVKDDVIDVCVDDSRTIVTGRAGPLKGNGVVLYSEDPSLRVTSIEIRPLNTGSPTRKPVR